MAIVTGDKSSIIQQGTPIVASTQVTFLGIGTQGDVAAKRRLVHPDTDLAPIVYWGNPTRSINIDNDVLKHPISAVITTLGSTRVVRFERGTDDVVVQEIWTGSDQEAAMPSFFLRQLYEYLNNPPAFSSSAQTYIQWLPRDRNAKTYNVEIISLRVGGGGRSDAAFDFVDVRARGGTFKGGDYQNPLDGLSVLETGLVDRTVTLRMRVVSEEV